MARRWRLGLPTLLKFAISLRLLHADGITRPQAEAMRPNLLTTTVLRECLQALAFYVVIFLALIAVALTVPLVRSGAPLMAVISTLPDQLAMPATIALPLALVTAILGTLGRMREQGELVALQAAGVSTLRMAWTLLPIGLLIAVMVGVLAHKVLPEASTRWRQGQANLVRQAIATKVARREFIYNSDGTSIAATDLANQRLQGVFANHQREDGQRVVLFAPEAGWVSSSDDTDGAALQLEFIDAQLIALPNPNESGGSTSLGTFPSLVTRLAQHNRDWSAKPDTQSTTTIHQRIQGYSRVREIWEATGTRDSFLSQLMAEAQATPTTAATFEWPALVTLASGVHCPHLIQMLAPDDRNNISRDAPPGTQTQVIEALWDRALQWIDDDGLREHVPLSWHSAAHDPISNAYIARTLFEQQLRPAVQPDPLHHLFSWILDNYERDNFADRFDRLLNKKITDNRLMWHLRWLLATMPIAYWLFACGLVHSMPSSNRLVTVAIGLVTVVVTLLPGIGYVKSASGNIGFHPAWLMWPLWIIVATSGAIMMWKNR